MTLFQISIGLALVANMAFGVMALGHQVRRGPNQAFFILSIFIALWLGSLAVSTMMTTEQALLFWVRQSSVASALAPLGMHVLRMTILNPHVSPLRHLLNSRYWLLAIAALLVLCQTNFFAHGIDLPVGQGSVATPHYGPGFGLFLFYFAVAWISLTWRYISDSRRVRGIQRTELQFVILGGGGGLLAGIILLVAPFVTGITELGALLPLGSVFVLDSVIAYGIATQSLMDVPAVLRRIVSYVLLAVYLAAIYIIFLFFIKRFVNMVLPTELPVAQLIATLAVAFSMVPAQGWLQQFSNQLFLNVQPLDVSKIMEKANLALQTVSSLDALLAHYPKLVAKTLGTDHVHIFIGDSEVLHLRSPDSSYLPPLQLGSPLPRWLLAHREPLVLDMIARSRPDEHMLAAGQALKDMHSAIAVGIYSKTAMEGVMLLGSRVSGRIYGIEEKRALQLLADQLAVAIENAKLYTQLQDSAIYNNLLLDHLVSGVVAANTQRIVTVFNREAQRMTGLEAREVLGKSIDTLPETLRDVLHITFEVGSGPRNTEAELPSRGSADTVSIQYGSSLFHSHTGKVLGALLVFHDVTAIKKLETQVRRTDRLASLGTLSAGMAHEIKNPLVTLKTFTQLLPERYDDPDFRTTFSSLLGDEVKRIDQLVNQLLRFARPAKPSLLPIHLHETIEGTLRLVAQQLRQKNVTLKRELGAESDLILGDNDMLVQAFLNFLLNAIDAMDGGGELTLATAIVAEETGQGSLWKYTDTQAQISLEIRDTGRGIRPEDLPHVFDPFFTTKSSGTGLGLSVAHGIIHEHKGIIHVTSEPGRGTTFSISIPLSRKEAVYDT